MKKYAGILVAAGLALVLSGCYETDNEIFSASDASAVYNLPGHYTFDGGGTLDIWEVPSSNDYRFDEVGKTGKSSTGYLRLMPIKGEIYLVQIKYDDEKTYFHEFYRFSSETKHFHPLALQSYDDAESLAKQYNVAMEMYETDYLTGKTDDIKVFLLAHRDLNFVDAPHDDN